MYDAFGLDWALLPNRRLHSRAEQQTINQSYKEACPSQEDLTKKARQSKVSKRTRVHVCVLRSSTFLVCTEYSHEMKRKKE
jgi:hypothetical protein